MYSSNTYLYFLDLSTNDIMLMSLSYTDYKEDNRHATAKLFKVFI